MPHLPLTEIRSYSTIRRNVYVTTGYYSLRLRRKRKIQINLQ